MMFDMFLGQTAPTGLGDVLKIPGICVILGLAIWYAGLLFEARTEKSWLKWLAFIPLFVGLAIGLQDTIQATDYVYQQTLSNRKTLYAHYLALVIPLGAVGTLVAWHLYLKRSGAYDRI